MNIFLVWFLWHSCPDLKARVSHCPVRTDKTFHYIVNWEQALVWASSTFLHRLLTSSKPVSTFLLDFLNGSYWFGVKNRGSLFLGMQQTLSVKFFKMVMATRLGQSKVEFSRLVSWQSQEISWSMEEHLLYMNVSHVLKNIGTNYVTRDIVITMAGRRTTDVICVAKHLFPRSCWRVT